jgi:hypothetical protein
LTKYSGDCSSYSLKIYFDAPADELKFENDGAQIILDGENTQDIAKDKAMSKKELT